MNNKLVYLHMYYLSHDSSHEYSNYIVSTCTVLQTIINNWIMRTIMGQVQLKQV